MSILRVALDVPLDTLFDYLDGGLAAEVGQRVLVPFGRRKLTGMVMEKAAGSGMAVERLKLVLQVFEGEPTLSSSALLMFRFCTDYYHYPLGQVVMSALPSRLREPRLAKLEKRFGYRLIPFGREAGVDSLPKQAVLQRKLWMALSQAEAMDEPGMVQLSDGWRTAVKPLLAKGLIERIELDAGPAISTAAPIAKPALNDDQQQAVEAIAARLTGFRVWLLHGITGSGKTEVYMRLLEAALAKKEAQVLVLVPEINLTPQLEGRFRARFPQQTMVSLHSQMNDGERF